MALFGTLPVMRMGYLKDRYRERFGINIVTPTSIEEIDRIIFDSPASRH